MIYKEEQLEKYFHPIFNNFFEKRLRLWNTNLTRYHSIMYRIETFYDL
mgnify:CR=1 FL=1